MSNPFFHVMIKVPTAKFEAILASYEKAFAPIGIVPTLRFPGMGGFGRGEEKFLWVKASEEPGNVHLAFNAGSRKEVDEAFAAAISAGFKDEGGPGLRAKYGPNYYGAFVIDEAGNNLEFAYNKPE